MLLPVLRRPEYSLSMGFRLEVRERPCSSRSSAAATSLCGREDRTSRAVRKTRLRQEAGVAGA